MEVIINQWLQDMVEDKASQMARAAFQAKYAGQSNEIDDILFWRGDHEDKPYTRYPWFEFRYKHDMIRISVFSVLKALDGEGT